MLEFIKTHRLTIIGYAATVAVLAALCVPMHYAMVYTKTFIERNLPFKEFFAYKPPSKKTLDHPSVVKPFECWEYSNVAPTKGVLTREFQQGQLVNEGLVTSGNTLAEGQDLSGGQPQTLLLCTFN